MRHIGASWRLPESKITQPENTANEINIMTLAIINQKQYNTRFITSWPSSHYLQMLDQQLVSSFWLTSRPISKRSNFHWDERASPPHDVSRIPPCDYPVTRSSVSLQSFSFECRGGETDLSTHHKLIILVLAGTHVNVRLLILIAFFHI
jgi:hypothetical protein